ncbi:MAG: hypothetical protein COC04_00560 [Gammaproteobacteria bacterium]|nr:MAG: hypothetical protein COC04_00560 [Gammaproteobacteria bacterium]
MTDTLIPVSKNKNPEALRLMIPDQSPGPLSIQIADDLSPETLEEFDESFKGIGVLVQRRFHSEDNKNTHWAHANLVALLNGETKESITDVTLRPFFPALIDNRRALFLDYHGFPLATPAFDDTRVPQDITSDSELGMSRSFYLAADIDSKTEFGGLPKLAYGAEFRTAAFAVTNSGTLPPLVRDPNKPHRPNKPGNISDDFVGSEVYQRRTAIGKITLSVPDEYKKAAAIVAKVQPLSADYPRQSLGCSINNIATLDIFRNVDGQGAINLGTGEAAAITLRNLEWQGDKASLIIEVMHMTLQGNLHAHPVAIKYRPGSDGKLTNTDFCTAYGLEMTITQKVLSLKRKTLNRKVTEEKTHHTFASELSPGPYWLRLTLKPNDSEASISFDDTLTSADPGNYYARPEAASRILMTKDEDTWAKPLRGKKILVIDFPRVGYIDFERWHANPNLPKANGLSDKVEDILMIAYLMRGSIDQNALSKNESSIAELLERLPDPAVHKLLVTLIPEDDLLEDTQRDGKKATAVSIILDIPAIPSPEFDTNTDNPDEYRKYLSGINTDLRAKINVSVGSEFIIDSSGDEIQISLMEGMVARLQVRPLIKASTVFPKSTYAAFDEGIVARALSKTVIVTKEKDDASTETDCIIFPGPDMVIETLADSLSVENQKDELRQLIPEMILCDPSGLDRAYALRLSQELPKDKKKSNIWRSLSHVEIVTQQWRFSGRPIYNWPTLPQYIKGASPVVELTTQNTKGILDFEKEAFFDRDNADSAHLTKRIEPLAPNGTTSTKTVGGELQRFSWSAPTATMFRHRFIMHSRYAAAMVKGVREVISWSTENNQSQSDTKNSSKIQAQKGSSTTWTYRVAVRASLSRIEVTRPQLRALLPLTAPAGHFEKMNAHPCPPLLAVLEEKPSVDGGLADRVLGMIHTGVHFGFPERPKDTDDLKEWTVQPLDIRKEIGPNPRMALHPLDVKAGLSTVLSHEGPIGLTFDVDTATNPAWANSQHLFTPKRIGKESNELSKEMHMGVSLMRILDPSWCDAPIEEDHSNLDIRRNWLIKFKTIPTNAEVVVGIGDKTLLKACENNRTLKIWNKTLDTDTKTNDWFDLCLLDDSHDHAISLLHQSLGEGRFRATLLHTQQRKNTDAGELITLGCDSTFNVLASILWSMPGLDADKSLPAHTLTPHFVDSVLPVASSAPTDVRWVKTIGDNTMVSVARLDNTVRKTELVPHDAIKVELLPHDVIEAEQEKPKVLSFTINNKQLWLKGEVAAQNVPNATHRHMAAIFTEYLSGPGRPLEIYTGSMLMIGRDLKLENDKVLTAIKNEKGRVRLLSFETPARPVMANAQKEKSIRQEYKQAYFDRKAVISESSPEEIRLRICFVRSDPKSKPISEIKFNYSVSDGSYIEQATKIEIGETATTTLFLDTIELVLTLQSDEIIYKTSAVNIFSDGSQKKFDDLGVAFNAPLNDGFAIAINAYNTNKSEVKELWADISCLFSEKKPQYNEFNFDWILSPNAHDQDVVEQTQPKALNKMTEAQGLVQMISPSIRVFSPKS